MMTGIGSVDNSTLFIRDMKMKIKTKFSLLLFKHYTPYAESPDGSVT